MWIAGAVDGFRAGDGLSSLACTVPKLDATPRTCRFTFQQAQE
jgi:hypothetical protein